MDNETKRGGARPGAGRKRLENGVPTVGVTLKMTVPQREKLSRLGGAPWVRKKIDQAREPS